MFGRFKKNRRNRHTHHHDNNCRHQHRNGRRCKIADSFSLRQAAQDDRYQIVFNNHLKLIEMGIVPGAIISVVKNEPQETNLIVNVSDCKYMISKEIAEDIMVIGVQDDFEGDKRIHKVK